MFDLTQTIHNVQSAGDSWGIAIIVCLILTIVCLKLFFFFNEKAKEDSLSEKSTTLGRDLSSIAAIICAIGFFAFFVPLHANKIAAMIEPAPEVQTWAKERYGIDMTLEQAEDILRTSDLDSAHPDDTSGTLIVTIDGEERLIAWNFVGQSKLMLSDTNLNELPVITP